MTACGAALPMRPTALHPAAFLAALLLLAVSWVGAARAEDAPPPRQAGANATPEAQEAEDIGRGLLASDDEARHQAIDRLLARIARGGDLGGFLEALSRANRAWADRHERLMEVWLHDAVHGSAAERERAVRLLTALGETAIRRLALELRHAQLHESPRRGAEAPEEEPPAPTPPEPDAAEPELAVGTPRVYELRDLVARGMNPVELRSLLLKTADAVEVKQFKTQFVVTAGDEGHERLCDRLHELRVRHRLDAQPSGTEGGAGAPAPAPAPDPAPAPEEAPEQVAEAAAADAEPAAAAPQPAGRPAPGMPWRLETTLVHVPRPALLGLADAPQADASDALADLRQAGLRTPLASLVRAPDAQVVEAWTKALRQVPDARTGLPLEGEPVVVPGAATRLFAGKAIRYSRDVHRTKGGAWTLVTGTIDHGIGVEVALHAEPASLRVDVVITRTDVGLPLPVVRFQPSPQAAPVELERPEWSLTRLRRSFDLPPEGGGALLSLDGLGDAEDDQLVLTMKLTPPSPK